MDLDGQWNPPEQWPESTPPLPGWVRASDGSWGPPSLGEATDSETLAASGSTPPIPEAPANPEATPGEKAFASYEPSPISPVQPQVARPDKHGLGLSFSEATAHYDETQDLQKARRRAWLAAFAAACLAAVLAGGIVVLLLLL